MTCFIARNLLTELVDDALPSSREPELREHLDGCPACSKELQELRRTRAVLRSLPVRRAPADFLSKVRAKAERKSALERVSIVLAPVLRLPRPAVGGLALAASLMVAVTVAIRHEQPEEGIFGYGGGPSAARVVSGPAEPKSEERGNISGAPMAEDKGKGVAGLDRSDTQEESVVAPDAKLEAQLKDTNRDQSTAAADELRKKSDVAIADPARNLGLSGGAGMARQSTESAGRSAMTPPPSAPVGGVASTATGSAAQPASTPVAKPGLYASTPGQRSEPAANAPVTAAKPKSAPIATGATGTESEEQDGFASSPEPAFDVESAPSSTRSAGAKEVAISKKEAKRRAESERASAAPSAQGAPSEWGADSAGASAETGDSGGGWDAASTAPSDDRGALAEAAVPSEKAPQKAAAPASAGAVATINARFTSASATAPATVADAARAAGAKLISGTPPSLGKSGASTNVVVELPVSAVPGFEQALDAQGTFELQGTPAGSRVRLRIEVVRE